MVFIVGLASCVFGGGGSTRIAMLQYYKFNTVCHQDHSLVLLPLSLMQVYVNDALAHHLEMALRGRLPETKRRRAKLIHKFRINQFP